MALRAVLLLGNYGVDGSWRHFAIRQLAGERSHSPTGGYGSQDKCGNAIAH
jgi:hypothetical protein